MTFAAMFQRDYLEARGHSPKSILFTKNEEFGSAEERELNRAYSAGIKASFSDNRENPYPNDNIKTQCFLLGLLAGGTLQFEKADREVEREEEMQVIRQRREQEQHLRNMARSK